MESRLLRLLGVEPGEEAMVTVLLSQSVFLGIFFGAFDISAHSLFLSVFDEKMMARAYVVSGLAGIILTSGYTWFQSRTQFRFFATFNLVFITLFTASLWLLLLIIPSNTITFLVFIMLGPLNIMAMLGFWGTAGRIFSLRQGKRLFGLVDAGLIIGVIVSCYAIPVLLSFNFSSHNILLVSSAAVLAATVLQITIGSKYRLSDGTGAPAKNKTEKESLTSHFTTDPYIRIMAIFIALSVMTAFFVQYSFMAVTREQYPAEADMARFLGLFTGSMMIFTLLIKLLVFSYLIRNYGLKTCLALTPVLIVTFTLIAIAIGMLMGFTPASAGFLIFFMILALSRMFSKALKDSIESPSFKVIYQTIDERIRFGIQSGMDGTVNEISALTSGLLLAGLGILSFIKLIHFSWALALISVIWLITAFKLYAEYRKSIRRALEPGVTHEGPETVATAGAPDNQVSAAISFENDFYGLVTGDLTSIDSEKGAGYYKLLLEYTERSKDICMLPALRKLNSSAHARAELKSRAAMITETLELALAEPGYSDDKYLPYRKEIIELRHPQTSEILRLLRDSSKEARKLAVMLIGKFRITDMLPELCQCIGKDELDIHAANAVKSFGEMASAELERYYMLSSGSVKTCKSVLRIMSAGCNKENTAFLFTRLWAGSRELRELALEGLLNCDFRPSEDEKDRLHQLISDTIGILVWNISAGLALRKQGDSSLLEILKSDTGRWNKFLFGLLSAAYDANSIVRIKENLDSGTTESVNFALEMIDIVIDESIKPKIIPLVDLIPDEEKIRNLYQFFPGEIPRYDQLIDSILNRDYNLLGIWIRANVLRKAGNINSPDIKESVSALLFSPEQILREEAALFLARTDKALLKTLLDRVPADKADKLRKLSAANTENRNLLFDKLSFLSGQLKEAGEDRLLLLANSIEFHTPSEFEELAPLAEPSILWILRAGTPDPEKVLILSGNKLPDFKNKPGDPYYYYSLRLKHVMDFCKGNPDLSAEMIEYIDRHEKQ